MVSHQMIEKIQQEKESTPINLSEAPFFPARYVFTFMGFLGLNLAIAYKVVLSVTIIAMVDTSSSKSKGRLGTECVANVLNATLTSHFGEDGLSSGPFDWDAKHQGLALGSFFYGFVVTQIPGGRLAEVFGGKWIYGFCHLITAIASLLCPVAANYSVYAFLALRIIQGLAEGTAFPCMHAMIARWVPINERGFLGTIIYTGLQVGNIITLPFAGFLSDSDFLGGWPAIYYVLGIAGCVWFLFWAVLVYESPEDHPFISKSELSFIKKGQGSESAHCKRPIPWSRVLTSVPVWALVITHLGQNWGYLTILTEMPSYFQNVLHLNIRKNGIASSLPFLLQAVMAGTAGYYGDKLRKSGKMGVNAIRKLSNTIGFVGPATCLVGVTLVGCNAKASIALFTLMLGLNGFTFSGFYVTHVDMAPHFAGTLMGMTNGISNMAGIGAPAVVGILTQDEQSVANWSRVFYICAAVYVFTSMVFICCGSAELMPWAVPKTGVQLELNNAYEMVTRERYGATSNGNSEVIK